MRRSASTCSLTFTDPRTAAVFGDIAIDLASEKLSTPEDAAADALIRSCAETDKGRAFARSLYTADVESCTQAFAFAFEEVSIWCDSHELEGLVETFLTHAVDCGLRCCVDDALALASGEREEMLRAAAPDMPEWHEVVEVARDPSGMVPASFVITLLLDNWEQIGELSTTWLLLRDLALVSTPAHACAEEGMRLALVRAVDACFAQARD